MELPSIKSEPGLRDSSNDDTQMAEARPTYKSWKKKYRKMRITFDQRMRESEDLHAVEQKAMRTAKRLAIDNDRLLDLLLDINDSPQIPFERRIDLNVDEDPDKDSDATDSDASDSTNKPTRSLKRLVNEVAHQSYADYTEHFPGLVDDLEPKDSQTYPTAFLTADDLDDYTYQLDSRLGMKGRPTLAPSAVGSTTTNTPANFHLRNPTSVYNWLRRHAPKTFLQDLEKEKDKDDRDKDDRKRKSKSKTSRSKPKASTGGRKEKDAEKDKDKDKEKVKEATESMDWDEDGGYDIPAASTTKGKRKRDEDGGYRPKGGSSRPAKKRKSKDLSAQSSKPTKARKSIP